MFKSIKRKIGLSEQSTSPWKRVIGFSALLFLVYFADAIVSFWVPTFLENKLNSAFFMGLVLSFSSLIGIGADLVFPQILKNMTIKRMVLLAILSSLIFIILLWVLTLRLIIPVLLLAMGVWGIYYEFLGFSNKQFVATSVSLQKRSAVWGIFGIFKTLAYLMGPVIAGILVKNSDLQVIIVPIALLLVSLVLFTRFRFRHDLVEIEVEKFNLLLEAEHWLVLIKSVWPVVIISLMLGLIDAVFWTTGAVMTAKLSSVSFLGAGFLAMYTLPTLYVGLIIARLGIYRKKKKLAEIFLLLAGIILSLLFFTEILYLQLMIILVASSALAVVYPLTEAVYSDMVSRMGKEKKHLIGLSNSTVSLAYIIGPVSAGYIASRMGENMTFVFMGALTAMVAFVLLITTPRKLQLPQNEIGKWN